MKMFLNQNYKESAGIVKFNEIVEKPQSPSQLQITHNLDTVLSIIL